jgi:hypothetical protein
VGVVADAGVSEPQRPVANLETGEPVAQGDVKRPAPPGHAGEEPVEQEPRLVAQDARDLVRRRRLELEGLAHEILGRQQGRGRGGVGDLEHRLRS